MVPFTDMDLNTLEPKGLFEKDSHDDILIKCGWNACLYQSKVDLFKCSKRDVTHDKWVTRHCPGGADYCLCDTES